MEVDLAQIYEDLAGTYYIDVAVIDPNSAELIDRTTYTIPLSITFNVTEPEI